MRTRLTEFVKGLAGIVRWRALKWRKSFILEVVGLLFMIIGIGLMWLPGAFIFTGGVIIFLAQALDRGEA